jgi:TRIAD3 protein (E3 ubiquitin-protein ligase RNF216)
VKERFLLNIDEWIFIHNLCTYFVCGSIRENNNRFLIQIPRIVSLASLHLLMTWYNPQPQPYVFYAIPLQVVPVYPFFLQIAPVYQLVNPVPIAPPPIPVAQEARADQLRDILPTLKPVKVLGVKCTFPKVSTAFHTALTYVMKIVADLDLARVSLLLREVIRSGQIPDDLHLRITVIGTNPNSPKSVVLAQQSLAFLQTAFDVAPAEISRVLADSRYLLTAAVTTLRQQGKPTRTAAHQPIRVTDAVVAVCLSVLWEEEQGEKKPFECQCCYRNVSIAKRVQCPNGHSVCQECVQMQINTALSEGKADIRCLAMDGCEQQIAHSELVRTMPRLLLRRLIETEARCAVFQAGIEALVQCHKCGFVWEFEGDDGTVTCPECRAQTCRSCKGVAHLGRTCEQMKEIDPERLIEERMNEAVIRTCPMCSIEFIKDRGCNKMECPQCRVWVCYICKKIIPKEVGYQHFWSGPTLCPPGHCPLWVSDEALRAVEAEDGRIAAMEDLHADGRLD